MKQPNRMYSTSGRRVANAYYAKQRKEKKKVQPFLCLTMFLVVASCTFMLTNLITMVSALVVYDTSHLVEVKEPITVSRLSYSVPSSDGYSGYLSNRTNQRIPENLEIRELMPSEVDTVVPSNTVTDQEEENVHTEEIVEEAPPEPVYEILNNEEAIIVLSKMVWGEYRDPDLVQQAACVWCALNRVDADGYGDDIVTVVTAKYQFTGYRKSNPVDPQIRELVEDVLVRWEREHNGEEDVGRVLPKDYLWFSGNSTTNWFRNAYKGNYTIWDWSLPSPY